MKLLIIGGAGFIGSAVIRDLIKDLLYHNWLAILTTDMGLTDEEIVWTYGKRCDTEVMFKVIRHYLNLEKEIQLRDFDGLVGHATIVMIRYCFLALQQRMETDERALGSLFYASAEQTVKGKLKVYQIWESKSVPPCSISI